ncbi:MAG TPA: sugar ABC transporter permease [Firmicutes bacterium]|nr:sugar ABC transporter permease [Bacillota bacterium]
MSNPTFNKIIWPIIALILVLLFNLFFTQHFFNIGIKNGHFFGSLIDILNRAAPTLIVAIGMTLVIATGGIDLSVGAVIAISGAVAALMIRPGYLHGDLSYPAPPPIIWLIIVPLCVCALAGAWNGFVVSYLKIPAMVGTLILMVAGRGIAQLITQGQILTFHAAQFQFIGTGFLFRLPFPVIIVAILLCLTYLFTRKTAIGLFIESIGDNPKASRYAGVNALRIEWLVYVFCAICAGIAGFIVTADIKGADGNNAGLNMEMDAILAVIIGGTPMTGGRACLTGTIIGGLVMQSLKTTILTRGVPPQYVMVVESLVVVAVCLLQSPSFRIKVMKAFSKAGRVSA